MNPTKQNIDIVHNFLKMDYLHVRQMQFVVKSKKTYLIPNFLTFAVVLFHFNYFGSTDTFLSSSLKIKKS